jgi:hypothetical protein
LFGGDFYVFLLITFYFLLVLGVLFLLCYNILIQVHKLVVDLNFFHNVLKTLGFVCSFSALKFLFCLVVFFCYWIYYVIYEVRVISLLRFVLLRYMIFLLVCLGFMLGGYLYLSLFRIVLVDWVVLCSPEICFVCWYDEKNFS